MNRAQLEHVIRAAATIAEYDEIVVVGSQAILRQFPDAPSDLRVSVEADVFEESARRSDLVDGSIDEGSPFHQTFGRTDRARDVSTLRTGWEWRCSVVR